MIAFICSRETDYLQDLTYAGLVEVLGKEMVWDFPRHWEYHSEKEFFWSMKAEYPRTLGFVASERPGNKNDFKLAVLGSVKPDALETFQGVFDQIKCPWVFVDGGDRASIGGDFKRTGGEASFKLFQDLCRKRPPALVFKRELASDSHDPLVFPFPFSFKKSLTPELSMQNMKQYDVLFWAVESSETRKKAFGILKGKYDCEENGSVTGQKFRKYGFKGAKYFEALSQAKIALSFRGEGFDTLRYWEVPACGSLLISEKPSIQIPDDFKDGTHAVFCKPDLSDLTEKIDYYIAHDSERQAIALEGKKHLLAHHTHIRRAEYFIERVKERIKLDLRS